MAHQPLKYHGGKSNLAKWLWSLTPTHTVRVHTHAGGLGELFQWPCVGYSEIVNDVSWLVTNFWRVMSEAPVWESFVRYVQATPFCEAMWNDAHRHMKTWREFYPFEDNLPCMKAAAEFFIHIRQSRQGLGKDYATEVKTRTRRGMNEPVAAWLSAIDGLADFHKRLARVRVYNQDAPVLIPKLDGAAVFFYCDPPYMHDTRISTDAYEYEMTTEQHEDLLSALAVIKGKFMLSGYPSELYSLWAREFGWNCYQKGIVNHASSSETKPVKSECVWCNYEPEYRGEVAQDENEIGCQEAVPDSV